MFNQDITIVNRYINPTTHTAEYKLSHLKGFYGSGNSVSVNGVDLVPNKRFTCRILKSTPGYVNARNYNGNGWTLQNGDYVVKGHINTFDPTNPGDAIKIDSYDIKDYGSYQMQHYVING